MRSLGRVVGVAAAVVAILASASAAPVVSNAGFEDPGVFGGPGNYYADIPQWDDPVANPTGLGLLPPDPRSTWLGGQTPPEGVQVGFIQNGGTMSQFTTTPIAAPMIVSMIRSSA